jgi:hypothetical protein
MLPCYDNPAIDFDLDPIDLSFGSLTIDEHAQAEPTEPPAPPARPFGFVAYARAYRPTPAPRPRPFGFVAYARAYR